MEITIDKATTSKTKAMKIALVEPVSDLNNDTNITITGMEPEFHKAAMQEKVSKLLSRNLSATKQSDENGWVPLHLAALCATSDVVEVLLRNDRSTTYMRDKKGRTALHFAALHEDSSVIEKIIEYCPDCCELVDEKGFNVFHYTTMGERKLFFELKHIMQDAPLISNLYNEKDDEGNTPLHLLARHAPKPKDYVCHPLLGERNPRMDIMACNKYGQTVLDVAVADIPPGLVEKNAMLNELQDIGARLGGRVPDKHPRENKQEKRHDLAVDKREEQYKTYNQDDLAGVATSLSVVAILIATVTFAAVFTLPGGLIQDKGSPTLKYNAAFITFVKTDSLSFVLSASSVLALFFSSIIRREEHVYELLLVKCAFLSMVAMGFMVIAFGMGVYTVLGVSKGFGIITLLIVLSFFFVFIIFLWRTCVSITRRRQSAYDGPYYRQIYDVETPRNIQLSHTL